MPVYDSLRWCGLEYNILLHFLNVLSEGKKGLLWSGEIEEIFKHFLKLYPISERKKIKDTLGLKISAVQEAIIHEKNVVFMLRPLVGIRESYVVSKEVDKIESISNEKYLAMCETVATGSPSIEEFSFSVDFSPFRIFKPEKPDPLLIGKGLSRISGIFFSKMRQNPDWVINSLLQFLMHRKIEAEPIFFSYPMDIVSLNRSIDKVIHLTEIYPNEESFNTLISEMRILGFARGWGKNALKINETFNILDKVLHSPSSEDFIELFERLPLIRNVVLVSVHGWFAQSKVLGRPDTGGQVVYDLNQAKALESYLKKIWEDSGLNILPKVVILTRLIPKADGTDVNQPKERIDGTENSYIIRVPFKKSDGSILPQWISRFKVWPYLNKFTSDSYYQLMIEFGGSPDLIMGNYSDGNFVATALGREWGCTTGVIAHALEKNKYKFSDIEWKSLENDYHFSIHYLNDMLSSNSADFIITSTYQEIAGTKDETGQYESYCVFTLPQNYRVRSGIDVYTPQFVINPPGFNDQICFPYSEKSKRDNLLVSQINEMCFSKDQINDSVGFLENPDKPPIFSMARLDKIKNIAGLVKAYATNQELRDRANLIIVGGLTSENKSNDIEEVQQIKTIHKIIKKFDLQKSIRWLPGETNPAKAAEFYRVVADKGGVFVQPALYEAFGLTVIEAMACGLPVVATKYGGPLESIEEGESGLLINPHSASDIARAIMRLISPEGKITKLWLHLSQGGIKRASEKFSWQNHVSILVDASVLYGFWSQLFSRDKEAVLNYIDALHHLLLLPKIKEWRE